MASIRVPFSLSSIANILLLLVLCLEHCCWHEGCNHSPLMVDALSDTALITGSTDGIGVTTAQNILNGKSDINEVLIHGRDVDRVRSTATSIQKSAATKRNVAVALPASDLSTVRGCYDLANSVLQYCGAPQPDSVNSPSGSSNLKILMNNAGVYSNKLVHTEEGLELTFAVNVLAPFVVTSMLLSTLLANGSRDDRSSNSRIVIASSVSQSWRLSKDYWDDPQYHKRQYSAHSAYSESKLLDAMLTIEMAQRLQDAGIDTSVLTCNCLDPGTVNTKMLLDGWGPIGIRVQDALDETWCCTSPELESITGQYFVGRSRRQASGCAYDTYHREKLWEILSELAPQAAAEWDRAVKMYSTK